MYSIGIPLMGIHSRCALLTSHGHMTHSNWHTKMNQNKSKNCHHKKIISIFAFASAFDKTFLFFCAAIFLSFLFSISTFIFLIGCPKQTFCDVEGIPRIWYFFYEWVWRIDKTKKRSQSNNNHVSQTHGMC